jgi:hypothetical protein
VDKYFQDKMEIQNLREILEGSTICLYDVTLSTWAGEKLKNFLSHSGLQLEVDKRIHLEKLNKLKSSGDWVHRKTKYGVSAFVKQDEVSVYHLHVE